MNTKFYKYCAVPMCKSTSTTTPEKLFIFVPKKKEIRRKWLTLARKDPATLKTSTTSYFCEDHFDLQRDMENYVKYTTMGTVSRITMKTGCLPTKFVCQLKRRQARSTFNLCRAAALKRQKLSIIKQYEGLEESKSIAVPFTSSDMKPSLTSAEGTKAYLQCEREKQMTTNSSDVTITKNNIDFIQYDNKSRTRFDLEVAPNIKTEIDNDQISFELEFSIKQENPVNLHDNYVKIEEVTIQSSADGTTAWVNEYDVKREYCECDLCHISYVDSETLFQHKQTHESDPLQIP